MAVQIYVAFMVSLLVAGALGLLTLIYIGFRWGAFAALKARAQNSPKWQAYFLSLLPPAAFAAAFLFDGNLSPHASQAFMALATPAVMGTCLRYNRRGWAAQHWGTF